MLKMITNDLTERQIIEEESTGFGFLSLLI
jgi:hypothetical protein